MSYLPHARRAGAVAGLAAAAVLGLATAASAHVTVNPDTAEQGSYAKVTFRVPNERDDASTTKLVVNLPADQPLTSVSVRPLPGWTAKAKKSKLPKPVQVEGAEVTEAITTITWSGGKVEPGQFQEFDVSLGPLPANTDRLVFTADQTYSNGEVVKWADKQAEGAAEPEHPAPVLKLVPKTEGTEAKLTAQVKPDSSAEDGTARTLGGAGLAVGALGLIAGGVGLARARSRS